MGSEKATPFNYPLGTKDDSARARIALPKSIPQFLPAFYLDTPMGDYELHRVNGSVAIELYGLDALNPLSKFANHASVFAAGALGAGGQTVIKRLPYNNPLDANDKGKATATVYLTLSKTKVNADQYDRGTTGKTKRDATGNLLYTADKVDTIRALLTVKSGAPISGLVPVTEAAGLTTKDGVALETTSYPIFSFEAIGHGSEYNNFGFGITTLTGNDLDTNLLAEGKLGNLISLFQRVGGKTNIIKNSVDGLTTKFSTEKGSQDSVFNKSNTLEIVFPKEYGVKPDPTGKEVIQHFENINVYYDNIDLAAKEIATSEIAAVASLGNAKPWNDFKASDIVDDRFKLANLFTMKNSGGQAYESIRYDESDVIGTTLKSVIGDKISASLETPFFLGGGKDNDLESATYNESYENAVYNEISKYSDPDSLESDLAINNVSAFVDSGFTFGMKMKLGKFLGYRKDVFLLGSTFTVGVPQDIGEAISTGNLIKGVYKLHPESTLFGTSTSRSAIVMGSGKLASGTYPHDLPLTYDLMIKLVKFAGAGDGAWKSTYKFSRQPGNIVSEMIEIEPKHIPNTIKNKLWDAGLIWVQNEDRDTYFYPASQTIYDDSTSVLNILLVNIAICYIVKQEEAIWREFTGADDLTNSRLKILAEESLQNRLEGRFADQYVVVPTIYFDKIDENRGYSWKTKVDLYAPNMKTVQESYVIAHRYSDLGA